MEVDGRALDEKAGAIAARPGWLAGLRIRQWAHFVLLPFATFDPGGPMPESLLAPLRGSVIAFLILGYGYLLNALADRTVDRDPAKNPLIGLRGSTTSHRVALVGLALATLGIAVASGRALVVVAALVALACGTVYSVGPRLKGWPGICTALNAACFAPLLFVGLGHADITAPHWGLAAVFVGLLLQNQLLHEAADADEDRRGGLLTTFLWLGPRGTAAVALALGAVLTAASVWVSASCGFPTLLGLHALPYALIFPWLIVRRGGDPDRMSALRVIHRHASGATGALVYALVAGA